MVPTEFPSRQPITPAFRQRSCRGIRVVRRRGESVSLKIGKAGQHLWLLNCIGAVAEKNPTSAAAVADKIAAAIETASEGLGLDHRVFAATPVPWIYPTIRGSGLQLWTYTARDTVTFQAAAYLRVLDGPKFEAQDLGVVKPGASRRRVR
jgi:hypothetical protein